MQKLQARRYTTVAIPTGLWENVQRVVHASGAYANEAEFIREAVRDKVQQVAVTERKELSDASAKKAILEYIRDRRQAYPSDITADLGVPYFTVVELISRLVEAGELEPVVGSS